ncbi:MAG TPA: helix-turn-helix domain-containing protein [Stellaceae bacterium]|nr:helix-turn-helix domain-containing protein [Stellaceae bacterium]
MPLTSLELSVADAPAVSAPPRERILAVARDLFYRHGIHAVGVDAIAEAAGTNKMTLYRHFASKDELVAECLRRLAAEMDAARTRIAAAHAGDPLGELFAWLRFLGEYKTNEAHRGCAFVNTAIELPDRNHPARRVVEDYKRQARERLVTMCRSASLDDPDLVADEIFLLCEGALVSRQSVGPNGPAARLVEMLQGIVAGHACRSA